ncbi:MAG: gamma carbonic anhydrase family protein [Polyangiaceae bacterium]|nr:gamma carbonic anhydrase family protein [Polyangiaceae bacterium]
MPVLPFGDHTPQLASGVFVAPTATVVGDVEMSAQSSIWYSAVARGDVGKIRIGERSNIQDGSILHMSYEETDTCIGCDVTVGHAATIHGARIEDGALIGMGSIILDHVVIGAQSWVAAGALVPTRMIVPPGVLVRGTPARIVRDLTPKEAAEGKHLATRYLGVAREHAESIANSS